MGDETLDTIVALATPPGRGGIGVVRVSGPQVPEIARDILGQLPEPRHADYLPFLDEQGEVLDWGIALHFQAPHSFTGEHVLELQGHGGPVIMDLLVQRILALGARAARPGEFSERAFLNDKLDLAQAEAIADLIDSASRQAARAALRSLSGEFSRRVHELTDKLISLRTYVEAAMDFPDEEVDFLSDAQLQQGLESVQAVLAEVEDAARQGYLLREGMSVVIAGQPNAGKSSLLNALAGRETAIVTEVPGTTRDVLREEIQLSGMPLHVIDTAGLRQSDDPVEQIGIRRAWEQIQQADRLLLVVDDIQGFAPEDQAIIDQLPENLPCTVIRNKADLSGRETGMAGDAGHHEVIVSAKTGQGLDELREHLLEVMGFNTAGEGHFIARRRHLDALQQAGDAMISARQRLVGQQAELLAEDLRQAQQHLSSITGEFSSDDLLGRIFSDFCIGK